MTLRGAPPASRDSIGARGTAAAGGRRQTQEVSGGQSYLSAPEKTLTFGLGEARQVDSLEVRWPDGRREIRRDIPGGTSLRVEKATTPKG